MARDKDYVALINTARWRRLRQERLTRHPLCERCEEEGRVRAASEVHHVLPVEAGLTRGEKAALMFDPGNLRALCHECHVLTHVEMGRSGKKHTRRRTEERLGRFRRRFLGSGEDTEGGRRGTEGGRRGTEG